MSMFVYTQFDPERKELIINLTSSVVAELCYAALVARFRRRLISYLSREVGQQNRQRGQ